MASLGQPARGIDAHDAQQRALADRLMAAVGDVGWVEDEALIDLKKTKVELATSKATVQRQNSIISQQTSTITELVETMKRARSKGAAALVDLADFVEKRSPALVASIARAVASRLGTEDPGAARS